ncbi:hypothetical protein LV84_00345 [Algoriphagus ratkowskyi]|uniref:Uncharacterized protein n=1 Tax=Algoriphagus ratkowskyi TaxID=57028 RepID=A0A2W7S1Z2_9BACT|nr:hypothetical protein LV84_00345 [Algoriphagus ratkowskyi]
MEHTANTFERFYAMLRNACLKQLNKNKQVAVLTAIPIAVETPKLRDAKFKMKKALITQGFFHLIFVFVEKEVVFGRIIWPNFFDGLIRFAIIF